MITLKSFLSISVILLLLTGAISSPEYLTNTDFTDNTCNGDQTTQNVWCHTSSKVIASWAVKSSSSLSTTGSCLMLDVGFAYSFSPAQNAFYLASYHTASSNACIKQTIDFIPQGSYTLGFNLFILDTSATNLYQVILKDSAGTTIFDSGSINTGINQNAQGNNVISVAINSLTNDYSNADLYICDQTVSVSANDPIIVGGPTLTRNGDSCVSGPTMKFSVPAVTSTACVTKDVYLNSYYCVKFQDDGAQCASCDTVRPQLVNIFVSPNTYKGCGQALIPGVLNYKKSTTAKDADGKYYLIPNACSGLPGLGANTLKITGTYAVTATQDTTAIACRVSQIHVTVWKLNIASGGVGSYGIQTCQTAYAIQASLAGISGQVCMKYVYKSSGCTNYVLDGQNQYVCTGCTSFYSLSQITSVSQVTPNPLPVIYTPNPLSNPRHCLNNLNARILDCNKYVSVFDGNSNYYYFCLNGECALPSQQVTVNKVQTTIPIGTYYGCTRELRYGTDPDTGVTHPQSDSCDLYSLTNALTVFPFCDTCTTGGTSSAATCKTVTDTCNSNQLPTNVKSAVYCASKYLIPGCISYSDYNSGSVSGCLACKDGWNIVTTSDESKTCVKTVINGCKKYANNGYCIECRSGVFIVNFKVCSTNVQSIDLLIPNCISAYWAGDYVICSICKNNYILQNFFNGATRCTLRNPLCQYYNASGICITCIPNYKLDNGTCVGSFTNGCSAIDINGKCTGCLQGYSLLNGACITKTGCPSGQYQNANGICLKGNVPNCRQYKSLSGACALCSTGFRFNTNLQCQQTTTVCNDDTTQFKYVVSNNICIKTDIKCIEVNFDGSCSICEGNFYPSGGQCVQYDPTQVSTGNTGGNTQNQQNMFTDQYGQYTLNSDGSRLYSNNAWKGLNIFVDGNGNLYVQYAPQVRGYLTGVLAGRMAFLDSNGDWYASNPDGSRYYYTGQKSGKSVFVQSNSSFFFLP